MDLKERIQELCKKNGISMNQLEQELGFGKGYISKLGKKHAECDHNPIDCAAFWCNGRLPNNMELVDRDYSKNVTVNIPDDDEHGEPFTDADLRTLWAHNDDQVVEFMLIMIYSGYRISAYSGMTVNLKERYFLGWVKTAAGKDRIVPIHSAIMPLVRRRMVADGVLFKGRTDYYRKKMRAKLSELGIQDHTPHDCRHTFSALCEKYGVNENDRKRMMGHSFGGDLTNGTYGHRTVEDLRAEIEKIKICDKLVTNRFDINRYKS